jgi:hypothetical protein
MGSHAKPRTTGRKTALGALAVGATLTGVGLTAAALDPATAVLTADPAPGNAAAIQLSGLADPVAVSPQSATLGSLSAAPSSGINSLTNAVLGTAGRAAHTATSGTFDVSTAQLTRPAASGSSGRSAIRPIEPSSGALTSGSGYTGKHRQTRSATAPAEVAPPADEATGAVSGLVPALTGLSSNVAPLSELVSGTGAQDTAAGLLGTATGTLDANSAGPLSGLLGSGSPLASLLGGL